MQFCWRCATSFIACTTSIDCIQLLCSLAERTKLATEGLHVSTGIISCLDFSPEDPNLVAAGSYSSIAAVYDAASGSAAYILSGHKGGLTQVGAPIITTSFTLCYCCLTAFELQSFIATDLDSAFMHSSHWLL